MKKTAKSYISFTRLEKSGIIGLSALLIILILIKATLFLWVRPDNNTDQEERLVSSWKAFKQNQAVIEPAVPGSKKKDFQDASDMTPTALPDSIDINTADSATLVRLKGIGPVTAGKIVARRKKRPFTNVNELHELCHMPSQTFELIKPHLTIGASDNR